jgi:hypothetical protein
LSRTIRVLDIGDDEAGGYTARQERIIMGFEDIIHFFKKNRRPPQHSHDGDNFERIYAVRLDQLRKLTAEDLALLIPMDTNGLLQGAAAAKTG